MIFLTACHPKGFVILRHEGSITCIESSSSIDVSYRRHDKESYNLDTVSDYWRMTNSKLLLNGH